MIQGLDISPRPPAHLDLTKPPDLEMTHNATGLGDITKPANLELSDLNVSNNLELTKPEFNNDSCVDQEVNGARYVLYDFFVMGYSITTLCPIVKLRK